MNLVARNTPVLFDEYKAERVSFSDILREMKRSRNGKTVENFQANQARKEKCKQAAAYAAACLYKGQMTLCRCD